MARLEVDFQSLSKVLKQRANQAQTTLNKVERDFEKLLKIWVQKGLKSQKEGKKQVDKILKIVKDTVDTEALLKKISKTDLYHKAVDGASELEKRVEETRNKVMHVLQIPTQTDLAKLQKKLDDLQKKVAALKKEAQKKCEEKKGDGSCEN